MPGGRDLGPLAVGSLSYTSRCVHTSRSLEDRSGGGEESVAEQGRDEWSGCQCTESDHKRQEPDSGRWFSSFGDGLPSGHSKITDILSGLITSQSQPKDQNRGTDVGDRGQGYVQVRRVRANRLRVTLSCSPDYPHHGVRMPKDQCQSVPSPLQGEGRGEWDGDAASCKPSFDTPVSPNRTQRLLALRAQLQATSAAQVRRLLVPVTW